MSGVEDLDQYGSWSNDPDYGPVWAPTVIVAGWAPYRFGHWAWVDPWGWTWIDDAPWGFAPFHYGRWAFRSNAWVWVPGAHTATRSMRLRSSHSLAAGDGTPAWPPVAASAGFLLVRMSPTSRPTAPTARAMHNVDVEHIAYVNRNVPGAVTVVSNETFVHGQPTAGAALLLPNDELGRAPVRGAVAPLVPQKESFLGGSFASHGPVAQPPASVMSRPVVARLYSATPGRSPLRRVSRPLQPIPASRLTRQHCRT